MHVVVIGNGIAGITAALRVRERQPDWRISVVSGESTHFWSRPALMYVFMGDLRYRDTKPYEDAFWERKRIELVRAWVTAIDVERKQLVLHGRAALGYDRLLLATGSKSNRFGWPGQDLDGVQGLYGLQDLARLTESCARARRAVVVGGGLIGIELAEMLHTRGIAVELLVREKGYWNNVLPREESEIVGELVREAGLGLALETELASIEDDGAGRACAVHTKAGRRIECEIVGLTAGVSPNLDLVRETPIATGRGVLVDRGFATSVADVFAVGDCAEIAMGEGEPNLLQQVWYTGELQGRVAGDALCGEDVRYEPGIWFNSAKFLDLEWQTYGRVKRDVPGQQDLVWVREDRRALVRLVHTDDEGLIGVNVLGARMRHRTCEAWIRDHRPIEYVLEHLAEAGFDPEFTRRHERTAVHAMQKELE